MWSICIKFHSLAIYVELEKEFCILSIKQRLKHLNREELEEFLVESLSVMAKLSNQATQLRERIDQLEGKM